MSNIPLFHSLIAVVNKCCCNLHDTNAHFAILGNFLLFSSFRAILVLLAFAFKYERDEVESHYLVLALMKMT